MKQLDLLINRTGMSLIEVLVTMGIMSIIMTVAAKSLLDQQNQIKFLEQKSEVLDLKLRLNNLLENSEYCKTTIDPNSSFDLRSVTQTQTNSTVITYSNLSTGPVSHPIILFTVGSKINSSLNAPIVEAITLSKFFKTTTNGIYKASFKINFTQLPQKFSLAGIEKDILVIVDDSNPASTKFVDCFGSSNSGAEKTFDLATCPNGMSKVDEFFPTKTCSGCSACTTLGGWGTKANCSYIVGGHQGCGGSSSYFSTVTCQAPITPTRVRCK